MTESETRAILDGIVDRITARFSPEKIVLFGSYARGTPDADSDVDLMVVMQEAGSKRRQATEIDLLLQGVPVPTDVIVVSPEDVERYRSSPGTIIHEAMREGRVIFERAA